MKKILIILAIFVLLATVASVLSVKEVRRQEDRIRESLKQQQMIQRNENPKKMMTGSKTTNKVEADELNTSTWEIYRNREYGFEVEHPKDWIAKEFVTACIGLSDCPTVCEKTPEECDVKGVSFFRDSPEGIGGSNLAVSITFVEDPAKDPVKNRSEEKTSKWHGVLSMFSGCHITATIYSKDAYFLFGSLVEATDLDDKNLTEKEKVACEANEVGLVFDEMLKTFKFLEENSKTIKPMPTTQEGWETYRNNEWGFEIKYPEDCSVKVGDDIGEDKSALLDCHAIEHFTLGTMPKDAQYFGSIHFSRVKNQKLQSKLNQLTTQCINSGTSEKKASKQIYSSKINNIGVILNKESCGHTVGAPSEIYFFDSEENKYISLTGNIFTDFNVVTNEYGDHKEGGDDVSTVIFGSFAWLD